MLLETNTKNKGYITISEYSKGFLLCIFEQKTHLHRKKKEKKGVSGRFYRKGFECIK